MHTIEYVINRSNDRYLSKDGHSCISIDRAKKYKHQSDAYQVLHDLREPDRSRCTIYAHIYVSPEDQKSRVVESWTVSKLTTTQTIELC